LYNKQQLIMIILKFLLFTTIGFIISFILTIIVTFIDLTITSPTSDEEINVVKTRNLNAYPYLWVVIIIVLYNIF
jgi:hypothetical protein